MGDLLITIPCEMVTFDRDKNGKFVGITTQGQKLGCDMYFGSGERDMTLQRFMNERVVGWIRDEKSNVIDNVVVFVNQPKQAKEMEPFSKYLDRRIEKLSADAKKVSRKFKMNKRCIHPAYKQIMGRILELRLLKKAKFGLLPG